MRRLRSLSAGNYAEKIEEIAVGFNRYLSYRKKICRGEFSALVFKDSRGEEAQKPPRKLTRNEQTACLKALSEMHKEYIELSFAKRVEFLESIHKERMENLRKQKDRVLKEVSQLKLRR